MQTPKILKAEFHIDFPEGYRCRFINSITERNVLHSHEYYEIFLTLTEDIEHQVNGVSKNLKLGSLVFIRPNDVHIYTKKDRPYKFINIAFSMELADEFFQFLGNDMDLEAMLKCDMPPTILLTKHEIKQTESLLNHINCIQGNDIKEKRLQVKYILASLFIKYFSKFTNLGATGHTPPSWLVRVCEQMKSPENFQIGVPAMISLSNKTYEHLLRNMKKHYDITVTEFINSLRLNYAANLIKNTNYSLTHICFEAGFNSSSYFSSCFKQYFNMTPTQYRNSENNSDKE